MRSTFLCSLLIFLGIAVLFAAPSDSVRHHHHRDTTKNLQRLLLPIFAYTPETHFSLGALGVALWKNEHPTLPTRTSNAELALLVTSRGQTILLPRYYIFTRGEKYLIDGLGQGLFNFHDYYYGRGNHTPPGSREPFTYNLVGWENRVQRRVFAKEKIFAGVETRLMRYYQLSEDPQGMLLTEKPAGYKGAFVAGLGPTFAWDARDNVINPSKGFYIDVRYTFHNKAFGSDLNYHRLLVDLRKYYNVNPRKRHILAFQAYGNFVRGDVPFKELAELGGLRNMRGYYRGRYRDNYLTAVQAEYRMPVYKWFGIVAFAGAGKVFSPTTVNFDELHYCYGGGVRVMVSKREKLNLRLDYGRGDPHYQGYLYVGFAESF